MKVALLLHGHLRTFDKTYKSIYQYINGDDISLDIFIHTWDTIDRKSPSYYNINYNKKIDAKVIERVFSCYKPINIECDTQILKYPNKTCPYNNISYEGHKYYFESFYKVNQLKKKYENENKFKYDIVIKSRPDVLFKTPLDLTKLNKKITYLLGNPINNNADLHSIGNFRAFNVITISNSENMDKIADFYHSIDKYIFVKLHKHSDFIDYILDLNLDLEILNYFYGKDWGFLRL